MTDNERKEILLKAKPILFNTEMVRAILDGRKTVTRRVIKPQPPSEMPSDHNICKMPIFTNEEVKSLWYMDVVKQYPFRRTRYFEKIAPYEIGDILYVRETWAQYHEHFLFKADCADTDFMMGQPGVTIKWHPSIHMPKEAARIFLRVTDVRVERLQDMTEDDAYKEGWSIPWCYHNVFENYPDSPIPCVAAGNPNCPADPPCNHSIPELFGSDIWDETIKKSDLDKYGWKANPWIWVIEFERVG